MANDTQPPKLYFPAVGGLYQLGSGLAYPWIRFWAGVFFVPHGMQKLFDMFGGSYDGTVQFFDNIGVSPGWLWVPVVGVFEVVGGLCLALGLFTRVAAAGGTIHLLVATFTVHMANGYFVNKGGYEYALLWCLICIAIFFKGGGKLSIDRAIGREF